MDGANDRVQIDDAADALRSGIGAISDPIVSRIGTGLPPDEYLVCLLEIAPRLVQLGGAEDYFSQEQIQLWGIDTFWALPHDPTVPYYRAGTRDMGDHACLFEFVVPMFPPLWLEKGVTDRYRGLLAAASWPMAVSLSVLDIKAPANWEGDPRVTEHWWHHKLDAASQTGKPLRMISFLTASKGVSTRDDVTRIPGLLSS